MNLRLVVDASVARSAGEIDSESEQANICTECLDIIDKKGYSIVLNKPLFNEWREHESRYSQRWYLIWITLIELSQT
ncbi:MAG: hypothetical protein P9X24_01765 [Candidatus Hatepunaea meridiana]|nr:hypothetical protein [Candidatus Hatepunaea meridiana]